MMKCRDFEAQLCDYIDDALDFDRRRAVEEHLLDCAACSDLHAETEFASRALRRSPTIEAPAELVADIIHNSIGYRGYTTGTANTAAAAPGESLPKLLRPIFGPILQPRFVMSLAITTLSFSMLTFQAQHLWRQWQDNEFSKAVFVASVEAKVDTARKSVVRFYDDILMVYELQTDFGKTPDPQPQQKVPHER